jgi:hypothetical protein
VNVAAENQIAHSMGGNVHVANWRTTAYCMATDSVRAENGKSCVLSTVALASAHAVSVKNFALSTVAPVCVPVASDANHVRNMTHGISRRTMWMTTVFLWTTTPLLTATRGAVDTCHARAFVIYLWPSCHRHVLLRRRRCSVSMMRNRTPTDVATPETCNRRV